MNQQTDTRNSPGWQSSEEHVKNRTGIISYTMLLLCNLYKTKVSSDIWGVCDAYIRLCVAE